MLCAHSLEMILQFNVYLHNLFLVNKSSLKVSKSLYCIFGLPQFGVRAK